MSYHLSMLQSRSEPSLLAEASDEMPSRGGGADRGHAMADRAEAVEDVEEVVERIHVIGRYLEALRGRITTPYRLTARDYDVLSRLFRAGSPHRLTPTQLAAGTAAPATTVTSRLDRLERRGLLVRVVDAKDRRSLLAELTPEGAALFQLVAADQARAEADLFGALPDAELDHLRGLLGIVMECCRARLGKASRGPATNSDGVRRKNGAEDAAVTPARGGPAVPDPK